MSSSETRVNDSNQPESEVGQPGSPMTFLQRRSTLILCVALFLLPLVIMGAVKSQSEYVNNIRQWFPNGFEEAKTYDWFVEQFDVDEMIVLSWPGCELDDERVEKLRLALEAAENDAGPLFSRVTSGPHMLSQLQSVGVSDREARKRISGLLLGKNGRTTCVLAYPVKALVKRRLDVVNRVYEIVEQEIEVLPDQLRAGGPTIDGAAVDLESKRSLQQFLWMTVVAVFMLTWYRMRDLPLTLLVIFFSLSCAAMSLAILYFTGGKMNLTMVMLPTLTFVLGVSGCVHMVNYYRKASTMGFGLRSADQAMQDAAYPVTLSAVTTAIGLLSLGVSRVTPIRLFGFYSALSVIASVVVVLVVMPAALHLLKGRISRWFSPQGKKRQTGTGNGGQPFNFDSGQLGLSITQLGGDSSASRCHITGSRCDSSQSLRENPEPLP